MNYSAFAASLVVAAAVGACTPAPTASSPTRPDPDTNFVPPFAHVQDVSGALRNYESLRETQILDDRCAVLEPNERTNLDTYIGKVTTLIAFNHADGAISGLNDRAQSDASAVPCDTAKNTIHVNYWTAMARQVDSSRMVYTWAMDGGTRCNNITPDENSTLFQAWNAAGIAIRNKYGIPVFAMTVELEQQNQGKSETFSCTDIRTMINVALKMAASNAVR